jgi:hypothetical protein
MLVNRKRIEHADPVPPGRERQRAGVGMNGLVRSGKATGVAGMLTRTSPGFGCRACCPIAGSSSGSPLRLAMMRARLAELVRGRQHRSDQPSQAGAPKGHLVLSRDGSQSGSGVIREYGCRVGISARSGTDSHPSPVSTPKSSCGARARRSELDARNLVV